MDGYSSIIYRFNYIFDTECTGGDRDRVRIPGGSPDLGTLTSTFIAATLVTASDSFPLMAIPLFILAGELMGSGGVSKRLLNVCNAFFGRITGGLAICTVVVCMFFAAVSGSGPATVAAVGSMVVPTMLERGIQNDLHWR